MRIKLRLATPQDAEALLEIYAPYVKQTAISFEYDVPGAAEFAGRIEQTLQRYPYLLAYVSDEATFANDERDENFKISASAAAQRVKFRLQMKHKIAQAVRQNKMAQI